MRQFWQDVVQILNELLNGYGWIFLAASAMTIVIATVVITKKDGILHGGIWTVLATSAAHAVSLLCVYLISWLLAPWVLSFEVPPVEGIWDMTIVNYPAALKLIWAMLLPYIMLVSGLLFGTLMGIWGRYQKHYEIVPMDILRASLWTIVGPILGMVAFSVLAAIFMLVMYFVAGVLTIIVLLIVLVSIFCRAICR